MASGWNLSVVPRVLSDVGPQEAELMRTGTSATEREKAAIQALYREQAQRLGRLAFLLTGDSEQAQDLVQEAFTRLFSRWRAVKNANALESYLRRTIVNLAHKTWRKSSNERSYLQRGQSRELDVSAGQPDLETREQLRQLLEALPFRQQAAIVLRYYEDLPEQEIAKALGCPLGTVKSSLSRGLQAMKIQLEDDPDE